MKYSINLLIKKEKGFFDALMYFIVHYFRYIVVFTLFVANCVFFYRIKVDQEIADLKEKIGYKKDIIIASTDMTKEVSRVGALTQKVSNVIAEQELYLQLHDYLFSKGIFPKNLVITDMTIKDKNVQFGGISPDLKLIKAFNKRLKDDNKFQTINLDEIQKTEKGDYSYSFSLEGFKAQSENVQSNNAQEGTSNL